MSACSSRTCAPLVERGVRVYVVTKTLEERAPASADDRRTDREQPRRWGVTVLHKLHMHEKLVFIDDDILWSGSLNSLSFTDTQEVMERRVSREVVEDYTRVLRLDALLAAHEAGEDRCPVCGGELVAAEARGGDPFYWRCLDCRLLHALASTGRRRATGCCRALAAAEPSSSDRCRRDRTGDARSTTATASA